MMPEVAAGAKFLDEHVPGWYSLIDLTTLKMDSCEFCILGQLEKHIPIPTDYDLYDEAVEGYDPGPDSYEIACVKLDIDNVLDHSDLGFIINRNDYSDWVKLKEAWITEIKKRMP